MKQGNPTKKFGIIAMIGAMLSGMISRPDGVSDTDLHERRNLLLTNGGHAQIPFKIQNQKQRRKQIRQMQGYRK